MRSGDRVRLGAAAADVYRLLREQYAVTHVYFHDARRVNVLRLHRPELHGDVIERATLLQAERSGSTAYGVELGPLGTLTLRAVTPWHVDGKLIGYVELGEDVGQLLRQFQYTFGIDVLVLLDKRLLNRAVWESGMREPGERPGWDTLDDAVIVSGTASKLPAALRAGLHGVTRAEIDAPLNIAFADGALRVGALPLSDAARRRFGTMVVLRDVSARTVEAQSAAVAMSSGAAVAGLILFIVLYSVLNHSEQRLAASRRQFIESNMAREELQRSYVSELEHLALHDALTGLPNRTLLLDRLKHAVETARRDGASLAVFLLDISRLKEVNDTLGHHNGDELLKQIAARLRDGLRKSDTLARAGGDEFVVVESNVNSDEAIRSISRIREILAAPFIIDGISLAIEAAAGIALFPEHGATATLLMQRADVAMRLAKQLKTEFVIYEYDHDPFTLRRLKLYGELCQAVKDGQLLLHYQPKIDVATGKVHAVEALMRWRHTTEGVISPAEFIPLAEQTGLIKPLTFWGLEEALRQRREWDGIGLDINIAVNLSARNLLDKSFPSYLDALLAKWELRACVLSLEVTESAIMTDPERALATLNALNEMGIALSIDDFGTGYSSLAYLQKLPVKELKIDKSFVTGVVDKPHDAAIARSIIELGHNMELRVIAEGVENAPTYQVFKTYGCDMVQGNYVSLPLPSDELAVWLRANNCASDAAIEAREHMS